MSALIVTAELGREDFGWLDAQRRQHYPAERNRLPAHFTIFHALPPSAEPEVRRELARQAAASAPGAMIAGLMDLGGGIAYRVVSDDLEAIRGDLADHLHGLLSAQDAQGWRPHITIQNKARPSEARSLLRALEKDFAVRPLRISGLGLHRYLGGPWERLGSWSFRG